MGRALEILAAFTEEDPQLSAGGLLKAGGPVAALRPRLIYNAGAWFPWCLWASCSASTGPRGVAPGPCVKRRLSISAALADRCCAKIWEERADSRPYWCRGGQMRLAIAELPSPQPLN